MSSIPQQVSTSDPAIRCEALIDATAAAQLLGVCAKTITRMAARREIPAIKIGKFWRFRASLLNEWILSRVKSHHSPCPARKER